MSALELKAYEILKLKFSEQEASTIIEYFEKKAEEKIVDKKDIFLTKDDKIDLISQIKDSRNEMIKWMFIFWIGQIVVIVGFMKMFN